MPNVTLNYKWLLVYVKCYTELGKFGFNRYFKRRKKCPVRGHVDQRGSNV